MPFEVVHPRISVSGISSFRWTLDEDLEFYAAAGIPTVGVAVHKFAKDITGGVEKIRAAGLRASSVCAATVGVSFVAPERDVPGALDALRPSIDVAAALDGAPCFFVSGPTPSRMPTDEAFAALGPALAPAVAYARTVGVPLALECSHTSTRDYGFVHSLVDAADFSREAGIGICLELQNCWLERHLRTLFRENVERILIVQVSDFKVGDAARLNRRVPGDGDIPLEWLLGSLLDVGYTGRFELEFLGPSIEDEGYPSAIRRGLDWMSERLDRWGA